MHTEILLYSGEGVPPPLQALASPVPSRSGHCIGALPLLFCTALRVACVRGYTTPCACIRSLSLHSYRLLASLVVLLSPLSRLIAGTLCRFHYVGRACVLAFFRLPYSLCLLRSLSLALLTLYLTVSILLSHWYWPVAPVGSRFRSLLASLFL